MSPKTCHTPSAAQTRRTLTGHTFCTTFFAIVPAYNRAHFLLFAIFLFSWACEGSAKPPRTEEGWSLVFNKLPGALISVWGTSENDVWTVGGDPGDGPTVLHYDGTS